MHEDWWWCMTEHEKIACQFQLRSFVKNWFNSLWCCNVVVNFQLWNIKVCVLGTTSDSIYWTNHCAQRPVWIKWFHFQTQSPPWHLPLLSTQTSSHLWASDWRYKVKIVDGPFFGKKIFQEFPDPLADWEDLEPGLQQRRSVHVSDSFDALIR